MIKIVCIFIIIISGALLLINIVQIKGGKRIVKKENLPKKVDAIIVLGAGIKDNGDPSNILDDRLSSALDIISIGIKGKLLLSGDHSRTDYNEVASMKKYILCKSNIDEKNIFLDHAGFSTYDSIYRANKIFRVKSAIIVTNEYHLPRALYLANKLGIDAYGYASDKRKYYYIQWYKQREKLAQIKDFMYVNIFKEKPTFLGDEIPINSSDGRVTDD